MRACVHDQWGGLAVIGRLDMRLRRPTLPCAPWPQASSRRAAGGRWAARAALPVALPVLTHSKKQRMLTATHRLFARCRHALPRVGPYANHRTYEVSDCGHLHCFDGGPWLVNVRTCLPLFPEVSRPSSDPDVPPSFWKSLLGESQTSSDINCPLREICFHVEQPVRIDPGDLNWVNVFEPSDGDLLSSQPDLPPSDCEPSDGDFLSSQPDLPPSNWTNQTPSVLNPPSSLIPSESPPPPPISPSSPAESTAKVRVHPSASFHIPHPTLTTLPATTTHRAAAPFPLSSPLARAGADSVHVGRPHRVRGGVGG